MIRPVFDSVRRIGKIAPGSIRPVLDYVIPKLNDPLPPMSGFGVVTVAGGKYLKYLWVLAKHTRALTDAPIICYHLGPKELDHPAVDLLRDMDVQFRDALPLMKADNYQSTHGWCAKSIAIIDSPFRDVLFLDADCIPLISPEEVLNHRDYSYGYLCFPDIQHCRKNDMLFPNMGLKRIPDWVEAEAGQFFVDKMRYWKEIQLYSWMNGRPRPFHDLAHGDKCLLQLACMKLQKPFQMAGTPSFDGAAITHRLTDGTEAFLHYGEHKRSGKLPAGISDLLHEFGQLTLQPA
jgi:hypothetical protein